MRGRERERESVCERERVCLRGRVREGAKGRVCGSDR